MLAQALESNRRKCNNCRGVNRFFRVSREKNDGSQDDGAAENASKFYSSSKVLNSSECLAKSTKKLSV